VLRYAVGFFRFLNVSNLPEIVRVDETGYVILRYFENG